MMVLIPFIYFTVLTCLIIVRRKGVDVAAYISGVYAISALFSVLAYFLHIGGENGLVGDYEPTLLPSVCYCVLLTLSIYPFYHLNSREIKKIPLVKEKSLDIFGWWMIAVFFITFFLLITDLREILSGDLRAARNMIYSDEEVETPTGIKYILAIPETLFSQFSPLVIFVFFYNICFRKRNILYNLLLLASSLTPVLKALMIVGRTQPIYWLLNLILGFVFFYPHLSPKKRRWIIIPVATTIAAMAIFIISVTISRFEDNSGAIASLVSYAGQSYLNFCYFFDTWHDQWFSLERLFPFTHYFILRTNFDLFQYRDCIMAVSGLNIGIFYTFLGDLMIDLTHWGMLVYIMLYFLICTQLMHRKQNDVMPFWQLIVFLIIVLIPLQGLFYYSYYKINSAYYYIGMAILAVYYKYQIKI